MILVGCDLHARKQQVAVLDSDTGEVQEVELSHHGEVVERFYAALPRPVTVAIESTGYALWFHALMRQCGHTLLSVTPPRSGPWSCERRRPTGATRSTCSTCSTTTACR